MTWVPVPAPRPLSSLRTEITRYVKLPEDPEALDVAHSGIISAVGKLNRFTWKWCVTSQTIAMVANQREYNLSDATIKEPIRMMTLDSDGNQVQRIRFLELQSFLAEYPTPGLTGDPCLYTVSNIREFGTFMFDITPSASWVSRNVSAKLWFCARVEPPRQPADVLEVPQEVEDFILWHAKAYIASMYDVDKIAFANTQALMAFQELRSDNMISHDWE